MPILVLTLLVGFMLATLTFSPLKKEHEEKSKPVNSALAKSHKFLYCLQVCLHLHIFYPPTLHIKGQDLTLLILY